MNRVKLSLRRRKTNKKHPPASASSNGNLIISAPLGDFRHMAHIGRDGADFGKEHLFVSSMEYHLMSSYLPSRLVCNLPAKRAKERVERELLKVRTGGSLSARAESSELSYFDRSESSFGEKIDDKVSAVTGK